MKPDSLIFDMDGTLWDAVDMYRQIWTRALDAQRITARITREDLLHYMGKNIFEIVNGLLPQLRPEQIDPFLEEIAVQNVKIIPETKADIFPGVQEGLEALSGKYSLFMLSNCEKGGLVNFMNYTQTTHLFTDFMEYGQNLMPKSHNLKLLKEKHHLHTPVYVGDTDSDSRESAKADVPFVFVTYGFGKTENYDWRFDSFPELVHYFINL